jgi:hypothetical protein
MLRERQPGRDAPVEILCVRVRQRPELQIPIVGIPVRDRRRQRLILAQLEIARVLEAVGRNALRKKSSPSRYPSSGLGEIALTAGCGLMPAIIAETGVRHANTPLRPCCRDVLDEPPTRRVGAPSVPLASRGSCDGWFMKNCRCDTVRGCPA